MVSPRPDAAQRARSPEDPLPRRWVALAVLLAVASACAGDGHGGDDVTGTGGSTVTATMPVTVLGTTRVPAPSTTAASSSVVSLAAELSAVEAGIRVAGVTDAELATLGRRQQLAYRAVNQHPEWWPRLADLVEPVAATPLAFHVAARQAQIDHDLAATTADTTAPDTTALGANAVPDATGPPTTVPAPTLPAWTIVEPLPIDVLRGYYAEAEAATGVPWQYLAAINFQETRMGRVVGVSTAGAVGPMQFLPATWAACCTGDPTVPRDAIMGAARYLAQLGAPGDMQAALYGYNPNSAYVGAVTAYAQNMIADERAYDGYHGWEVFYSTPMGTVRLPVGYSATTPIDLASYVRDRPEDLLPPG